MSKHNRNGGVAGVIIPVFFAILFSTAAVYVYMNKEIIREKYRIDYIPQNEHLASVSIEPAEETESENIPKDEWYLKLVNKDNPLPSDYYVDTVEYEGIYVDVRIADSLNEMIADAKNDGVKLILESSYNDFNTQNALNLAQYSSNINAGMNADDASSLLNVSEAPAIFSEHCLGLAVDFCLENGSKTLDFQNSDQFSWLSEHSAEYGFILRYSAAKESKTGVMYQPYHYRYVGSEQAVLINQSGLSLEEYLAQ